jgi:DNA polymerase III alpha subunit
MDVDIDLASKFDPLSHFSAVRASMIKNRELIKHNAGIYFQDIPVDPITNLAAIPYKEAEELGYFKIDFLHIGLLDLFDSKDEIRALLKIPPKWELLENQDVVAKLFQLGKHFDLVYSVKPRSVLEIADCISLIRPHGRRLVQGYLRDRVATRKFLYRKPDDGLVWFKKGHSVAYALNVVLQLHLIDGEVL